WTVKFGSGTVLLLNVSLTSAVPVCARAIPPTARTNSVARPIRPASVVFPARAMPPSRGSPIRVPTPGRGNTFGTVGTSGLPCGMRLDRRGFLRVALTTNGAATATGPDIGDRRIDREIAIRRSVDSRRGHAQMGSRRGPGRHAGVPRDRFEQPGVLGV